MDVESLHVLSTGLRVVACVCILKGAVLVAAGEAVVVTLVPGVWRCSLGSPSNQLNDLDP